MHNLASLYRHSDHYRWKKVTSCIYNLLGGQRWVDHYGEMVITNGDQCSCRLTFVKVSSSLKYLLSHALESANQIGTDSRAVAPTPAGPAMAGPVFAVSLGFTHAQ